MANRAKARIHKSKTVDHYFKISEPMEQAAQNLIRHIGIATTTKSSMDRGLWWIAVETLSNLRPQLAKKILRQSIIRTDLFGSGRPTEGRIIASYYVPENKFTEEEELALTSALEAIVEE